MAITNRERVARGLEILKAGLVPFVERELASAHGEGWADEVSSWGRRGLDRTPEGGVRWDTHALLRTMVATWESAFKKTLGPFGRSLVGELLETRNRFAHEETFGSSDTLRALDSIQRLLASVSASEEARQVEALLVELQRLVFAEQTRQKTRAAAAIEGKPQAGLKPWREVVIPHPDVASGRYVQAEFAADLAQVARGEGTDEYRDPVEFYRRTFLTDGLQELLVGALRRLAGEGGDPVVELQTNFGGGKTHSMLALFHLFGGTEAARLPGVEPVLKAAGLDRAPAARRAVLVGTALSPGEVSVKPDGTRVHTLWGEMAWQLAGEAGYAMVADSDARATSPGSQVLAELLSAHAPALVLVDEWVAYARQLVGKRALPAGDFEVQASFAQALTEAARAADRALVVASVPASRVEIGGEHGQYALEALRNVFERLGTPWRPASADEGFEIARRRLFEPMIDKDAFLARDAVVSAFARMYQEHRADFPSGCAEGAYRRKLEAAYPIHPDLFDQLYGEWSTLDKFQRTRGVLRLLANVIHRLWEAQDGGLLIMPASAPMDDPGVKSELTRYLPDVWEPIISEDVDGPSSLPMELDRANPTLGRYSACRRVARTLYIGTAPGSTGKNPGVDDRRVRLGCAQPGESPATFGDALRRVAERAKHVHQDGARYWLSTKANLNRVADDRAADLARKPEELHAELVKRLRADRTRGLWRAVHVCPATSADVEDGPDARLVILSPLFPHRKGQDESLSPAKREARAILEWRGTSPRLNRNALVFLAPDGQRLEELLQATASLLAWRSILKDSETLDLAESQKKQAKLKEAGAAEVVDLRVKETWVHALVPHQAGHAAELELDEVRVTGDEALAKRTGEKLKQEEALLDVLGWDRLRMELDKHLWQDRDHVSVGELAEWFPRHTYLPRLQSKGTIHAAVFDGASSLSPYDTFAVSTGYDEAKGRYRGLTFGGVDPGPIQDGTLLVKPEAAARQKDDKPSTLPPPGPPGTARPSDRPAADGGGAEPAPAGPPNTFYGSVRLDPTRVGRDAGRVAEEVIQLLSTLPGAETDVTLEIRIKVPGGVEEKTVRNVTENCGTLKFGACGFEHR